MADFPMLFRIQLSWRKSGSKGIWGLVFSDVTASRKSPEKIPRQYVFRQKHRGCMSALACKIERFCLAPCIGLSRATLPKTVIVSKVRHGYTLTDQMRFSVHHAVASKKRFDPSGSFIKP
jgi:hypothetical protein